MTESTTASRHDIKWVYEDNEPCWVHCGERRDGRYVTSAGNVIGNFTHVQHFEVFYIIKLIDPNAPHFVVRDALQMSPSPDVEPAMVRPKPSMDGGRWPDEAVGMAEGVPLPSHLRTRFVPGLSIDSIGDNVSDSNEVEGEIILDDAEGEDDDDI